jgi:hypothetical protein
MIITILILPKIICMLLVFHDIKYLNIGNIDMFLTHDKEIGGYC